ncbi:MAG TPA: hypothetical protein DCW57_13770, partial [Planctomycetaceae bacterium]|nr:hypothetical protein [Planctomycetaceae bacterium]
LDGKETKDRSDTDNIVRLNIQRSVREILQKSTAISALVESGQIGIVGMMYDVTTGICHVMNETSHGIATIEPEASHET